MRIGLFTPPNTIGHQSLPSLLAQVLQAEDDGFSSFWFVHLPMSGNDTLVAIAVAGQKTNRIELGTSVVPLYGRHPLVLAQQAATAQVATGGRLTLGIGLSHQPVVEGVLGLSYDKPARAMREYLSILRPLLEGEAIDFRGQVYRVNASLQVPEARPIPVLIAALAPLMLNIAGELADGTITWMAGRKTIETHIAPRIRAAAVAADRPPPRICVALPVAVTDDADAAREVAARSLQRYGQLPNYRRILDIEGADGPADIAVVGNEETVEQQLRGLAEAGTTDFLASIFPVGSEPAQSTARTWNFLKTIIP